VSEYLVCVPDGPARETDTPAGPGNLLEIINSRRLTDRFYKTKPRAVVATAETERDAFNVVKVIVEDFLADNPDRDFTKFKEWCMKWRR